MMFTNPFSVLQQNIKKSAVNSTAYPDEEAINCLFVIYSGQAETYSQDTVSQQIMQALARVQDYSYVKLCYAVFQMFVKAQTVPKTARDVSALPYHFLRFRQTFQKSFSDVPYAVLYGQFVENALATAQAQQQQSSPPRHLQPLIQMLRAAGALCQQDDSDQLLLFLKNQTLRHTIREISQLLTVSADYYAQNGNLDFLKPHLPDLRLVIRLLTAACTANSVQAQIADIPDLLESMVRGKFSSEALTQHQRMAGQAAYQAPPPQAQQYYPPPQYYQLPQAPPAQQPQYQQPYYYQPQYQQQPQMAPQRPQYPQSWPSQPPQMAPQTPPQFPMPAAQQFASPSLAGSWGPQPAPTQPPQAAQQFNGPQIQQFYRVQQPAQMQMQAQPGPQQAARPADPLADLLGM